MSIAVGQHASRSLTLTAEHVRKFAEISGDHNPLHFDAAFAARTKFGRLVVQGGLTTGLVHALVAMDMPGPGTVFLSQKLEVHSARLHRRHDHCGSRSHLCASFETGDPVTRADHATRRHDRVGRRGVVFYVC
jgi:hypothetical protein